MCHLWEKSVLASLFIAFLLFLSGCSDGESENVEAPAHQAEVHWGYESDNGPEHWGELASHFTLCSLGKKQSPIDVTTSRATPDDLPDIIFDYQPTTLHILNNGHTVQFNYDGGSSISISGVAYELQQFHFHAPSEHTLAGAHFAMEMHLVHRDAQGNLAVVGAMIARGAENQSFVAAWESLPADAGEEQHVSEVTVNASSLLPSEWLSYRYEGSLTTPPCTEGVKWFVLTTPIELSEGQISTFENIFRNNNRPVQPLYGREVLVDSSADSH